VIEMCGRFYLEISIEDLAERYEIEDFDQISFTKGEIFPTNKAPIVINEGVNKVIESKWSYPVQGINKTIINARVETIAEKASFKQSIYYRRCIVPANSFFEWQGEGRDKTKFKITKEKENLFSMAGVYNFFMNKEGDAYLGFVIITKEANETMSKLHHRMPLVLDREYENHWLDKNINSKTDITDLINSARGIDTNLKIEEIIKKDSYKQLSFV
jgi:putative SOS response-associated peptidase YedK